jgi:hypothetical protein
MRYYIHSFSGGCMMKRMIFLSCLLAIFAARVRGDTMSMIVNEWNAVGDDKYLQKDSSTPGTDTYFGHVLGNGDNWVELAVLDDHLDIRGWSLQWDNADPSNGSLTFSNAGIWSDLRQGSLIVLHQNDASNDSTGGIGALASDTSYNPLAADWNILASIDDATLITDNNLNWHVDKSNWEARIVDQTGGVVQNYVGESTAPNAVYKTSGGIGSTEVGALSDGPGKTTLAYKVKNTVSTFLSPNSGQEAGFAALREAVVPEPGTLALLLCGIAVAFGSAHFRGKTRS